MGAGDVHLGTATWPPNMDPSEGRHKFHAQMGLARKAPEVLPSSLRVTTGQAAGLLHANALV